MTEDDAPPPPEENEREWWDMMFNWDMQEAFDADE